jgi:hypothetical protein
MTRLVLQRGVLRICSDKCNMPRKNKENIFRFSFPLSRSTVNEFMTCSILLQQKQVISRNVQEMNNMVEV